MNINATGLSFKDVFIIPQYSEISSRANVDTSTSFGDITLSVPIISANMDSVTGPEMAVAMFNAGGIGALHRFWSIDDNAKAFREVKSSGANCFVSVGVNGNGYNDNLQRAATLYREGARFFIIDIAHGHSIQMKEMLKELRHLPDIFVVAGNVATPQAISDLEDWGADMIKVGIGPGAACLTKNVTGVTYPQWSAVYDCAKVAKVPIIADGGCTEIGDIVKALGCGANLVMLGRMLASANETPSIIIDGHKVYRGMASKDAMKKIRTTDNLPTPEGKAIIIEEQSVPATELMRDIAGGLKSAFSYTGAKNLTEFQAKVLFGIKH